MESHSDDQAPVTYENCDRLAGPFFHGTKAHLRPGDELVPGQVSNFQSGRVMNHIYFTSQVVPAAALGAQLAMALSGLEGDGHVYEVEPLGPFEDDPNVTNKRFPGNPTRSFRSQHPLRIVAELDDWERLPAEQVQAMLASLENLRAEGRDVIED
ncbi:NAD(+)--rifampin ADP-ribosyltransferase [Nocardioides nanhaiensis]|uniref:NAD(+)--rifampin ADP-ribosyltransferase n=1 Tax=Nocardioides nanhaiensis TaxID=1476871 RepID=A0ABP8VS29_9ACTN